MNREKAKNVIIVVLLLIIVIGTCVFLSLQTSKEDSQKDSSSDKITTSDNQIQKQAEAESAAVKDEEKKSFTEISVSEYLEMYEGSLNKLIFIGRPTCSYCTVATPILEHIAYLNQLTIYYLNTDNFSSDDQTNLVQSDDYFKSFGTPVLLVVSNGEIVSNTKGLNTTENYTSFLKENGFIQ